LRYSQHLTIGRLGVVQARTSPYRTGMAQQILRPFDVVSSAALLVLSVVAFFAVPEHLRSWVIPTLLAVNVLKIAAVEFVRRRRRIAASIQLPRPESNGPTA
jgi:hypothetical protein